MSTILTLLSLLKVYSPFRFGFFVVFTLLASLLEATFVPLLYATLEKLSALSSSSSTDQFSLGLSLIGIDMEQISPFILIYSLLLVTSLALVSNSFSLLLKSSIIRKTGFQVSLDCFKRLSFQDYSYFILNSGASANVLFANYIENWVIANKNFLNFVRFFSNFVLVIASLLIINYKVAFALFSAIGLMYGTFAIVLFPRIKRTSKNVALQKKNESELVSDLICNIRDIINYSAQLYFIEKYSNVLKLLRTSQSKVVLLTNIPKVAIESAVSIIISVLLFFILVSDSNFFNVSMLLFVFGFGLQKSLSGFQGLYTAFSNLNGYSSDVSRLFSFLSNENYNFTSIDKQKYLYLGNNDKLEAQKLLSAGNCIVFEDVSFSYSSSSEKVFSSISFEIPLRKVIGIVGVSGSGKSTFVDLLSCALTPSTGSISINSTCNFSDKKSYRLISKLISVVSQEPTLINGSIVENITLGLNRSEIDWLRLQKCIEYACLSSIVDKLPNGVDHLCSDNGVNFSGGEKQRIGIARALYSNPQILILDEATSALDVRTESSIINNIHDYFGELTIIMVAHKVHTLQKCDKVYEITCHGIGEVDFDSLSLVLNKSSS